MVDFLPSICKALGLIYSTHMRAHTPENLAWMVLHFTLLLSAINQHHQVRINKSLLLSATSQHHHVCINRMLGGLTHAQGA